MAESKHTPGPWATDAEFLDETVLGADGIMVADCTITVSRKFGSRTDAINRANARLIAAAPELVEPFDGVDDADWEWLLTHLGFSGHGRFWREVFTKLRPAIAKATGSA